MILWLSSVFYFILWFSLLAVLWQFQVDSKRTQSYRYMYPFSPKLPSHRGCDITPNSFLCQHVYCLKIKDSPFLVTSISNLCTYSRELKWVSFSLWFCQFAVNISQTFLPPWIFHCEWKWINSVISYKIFSDQNRKYQKLRIIICKMRYIYYMGTSC